MQDSFPFFLIALAKKPRNFATNNSTKHTIMKKLLAFFLATSFAVVPAFAITVSSTGNPLPIIVENPGSGGGEGHRSVPEVPFTGYVDIILNIAVLNFSTPCGTVDITFSNLATGAYYNTQINGTGSVIIPLSLSSGLWQVTFVLLSGETYLGEFEIE